MEKNFMMDLVRGLFSVIDLVIYSFIELLYNTFMQVSNVMFLSQDTIQEFSYRIYVILGFVMLFKVAFSLIQIFINPDNMFGDKGVTKIIQRIVIMLIILVSVPTIFSTAYRIQGIIVKDNILGNLIMGTSSLNQDDLNERVNNMGSMMGDTIISGFFTYGGDSNTDTTNLMDVGGTGTYAFNNDNATRATNDVYDYNYRFGFSTLAGLATAFFLITFLFDIAVRAAQLTILQVIAPIPIMMSIDEKGKKNLDNWIKISVKTYMDLFARLVIIWFVIFVIIEISVSGNFGFYEVGTNNKAETDAFTVAMLILGLLLFAREAPKWIMDLLGIKDTKLELNPFKKLNKTGIPGLTTIAAGGAVGAIGNFMNAKGVKGADLTPGRRVQSAIGGLFGGMKNAGSQVLKNKGNKNWDSLYEGARRTQNNRRLFEGGHTMFSKVQDTWSDMTGQKFQGTTSMLKAKITVVENDLSNIKGREETARNAFALALKDSSAFSTYDKIFDFANKKNAKGEIIEYVNKGSEISNLVSKSPEKKDEAGKLLELYNSLNELDITGRKLTNDLNDLKEQKESAKGKSSK